MKKTLLTIVLLALTCLATSTASADNNVTIRAGYNPDSQYVTIVPQLTTHVNPYFSGFRIKNDDGKVMNRGVLVSGLELSLSDQYLTLTFNGGATYARDAEYYGQEKHGWNAGAGVYHNLGTHFMSVGFSYQYTSNFNNDNDNANSVNTFDDIENGLAYASFNLLF